MLPAGHIGLCHIGQYIGYIICSNHDDNSLILIMARNLLIRFLCTFSLLF